MLNNDLNPLVRIGTTITPAPPTQKKALQEFQKRIMITLKAEWSTEFIHWNAVVDAFKSMAAHPGMKRRSAEPSLKKHLWELESLLKEEFNDIEREISLLLTSAQLANLEMEGYDFEDRLSDIYGDIAFFRKNARNLELKFIQNIQQQIPLAIY